MLVRGKLVVKPFRQREDALIAWGHGERFHSFHHGRKMTEWLVVDVSSGDG